MNNELWEKAEQLSNRQYSISVEEDSLSNGQAIYLARHPELLGCKAQGTTITEAIKNLDEARVDYIYTLLEAGLDIPEPIVSIPTPISQSGINAQLWIFDASAKTGNETRIDPILQSDQKEEVFSLFLQGSLTEHS